MGKIPDACMTCNVRVRPLGCRATDCEHFIDGTDEVITSEGVRNEASND